MELEICFICGVKIGRGNRSEVGSQEKMDKLVSVSNTVEHSRLEHPRPLVMVLVPWNPTVSPLIRPE